MCACYSRNTSKVLPTFLINNHDFLPYHCGYRNQHSCWAQYLSERSAVYSTTFMVWILHVLECTSFSLQCLGDTHLWFFFLPHSDVKLSLKYTAQGLNERIPLSINKYVLSAWSRDNRPPTISHCQLIIVYVWKHTVVISCLAPKTTL